MKVMAEAGWIIVFVFTAMNGGVNDIATKQCPTKLDLMAGSSCDRTAGRGVIRAQAGCLQKIILKSYFLLSTNSSIFSGFPFISFPSSSSMAFIASVFSFIST
jgi:hypothetical protein